ncbi:MAG: O-phosphoseryl-tRNA(Sec) selenium transferase [Candidatus Lokiarchaeota archaeon]|nr:O-phosphoseryl-tRNA(Sec) selenium transferase [Candidatus Lokiarchaeota archaeon]
MVNIDNIIDLFKKSKVPENIINRGKIGLDRFLNPIKVLLEQKCVPEEPWNDEQIKFFFKILSQMDIDKDTRIAHVGEREARIVSNMQLEISGGFCHGIGRSGFLTAPQPKAPGSSIMYEIANYLAKDAMKKFGLPNIKAAIIVPVATGMSLTLTLSALKPKIKDNIVLEKNKILIPQLDHNSILKSIKFLDLIPKIIEGKIFGDAVRITIEDIEKEYDQNCFGIISFTSFFPPRESDDLKEISKFAKKKDLVHIIINAYGVQSPFWMKLIRSAIDAGRVDAIIQSTDKNFLTPIGGSLIASPIKQNIVKISKTYPGRASASPIINFIISILRLGSRGYYTLINEQKENYKLLKDELNIFANQINERILEVSNPIAIALSLSNFNRNKLRDLGGALYNLGVTGPRVFNPEEEQFGTCTKKVYHTPYIVMNAAIGAKKEEIIKAVKRLKKAYIQIMKK